jgi:DNA-binding transcriptional ArsR family regulator
MVKHTLDFSLLTNLQKYVTIWLHMTTSATSYRAIADTTRRRILDLLREESLTAGAIAERFPKISRPAVSKHLAILRRSRLVTIEKRGRERVYALNAAPLRAVADWVREYETFWDEQLQALKEYVESEADQEETDAES